jgi:hypothetical protein
MNEKDRDIEIAAQKHKENLRKLRAAGNRGIALEEERYNKEILTINQKYNLLVEQEVKAYLTRVRSENLSSYDVLIRGEELYHEERTKLKMTDLQEDLEFVDKVKKLEKDKLLATQLYRKNDLADAQKAQMEKIKAAGATNADILDLQKLFNDEIKTQEQTFTLELLQLDKVRQNARIDLLNQAANETVKVESDKIQEVINVLDQLSARLNFDYNEDIERNNKKIQLLKEQQALEERLAQGQADTLYRIRRDYGDKINAIEIENTKIKFAEEQQRYQIAVIYANAAAQVGQILQQLAGERRELALIGLAIEKAAALTSIAINAKKNFIADGGIKSPLAWANLAAAGVQAAAVVASYILGVASIKKAGSASSSSAGTTSGGAGAAGREQYHGLGRNYEEGGLINGPRHAQGGVMIEAEGGEAVMTRGAVTAFGPLLSALNQMGGGTSFNSAITSGGPSFDNPKVANTNTIQNPMVIKTYVVSNDMTSEQEKQSRLKDLSTL